MLSTMMRRAARAAIGAAAAALAFGVMIGPGASPAFADDALPWLSSALDGPTGSPALRRTGRANRAMRLGAAERSDDAPARPRSRSRGTRVASLGDSYAPPARKRTPSLSGGSVNWVASSGCLNSSLRNILYRVASVAGSVTVSSTCRSRSHNRRVGGATKSYHLTGDAADFRVRGSARAALAYLRSSGAGGIKHYGGGLFHIDTGPRRSW